MGKKKAGSGKAAAKAAKKEKAEKLANKKATKQAKKENALVGGGGGGKGGNTGGKKKGGAKPQADDDEEDLDLLLARYRAKWEEEHAVNEEKIGGPPSRRANATLTPCPLGNDLYLFGGEYFDGERVSFYQDMYRYIPERNEWRSYASQNQPGPRSAHQVAATPSQGGMLWLFGGEFSGARQNAFHHYRDLWAFSIETKAWERIDTKVRPSARSGHRMTFWKHFLVLFGGFIDTGVKTQYLNDLWVFDTQNTFKWTEIKQNDLRRPTPRSGFSLLSTADGIVLHGGYCKKYVKGQRTQGVALEDTWFLKMDEDLKNLDWVKRRKVGYVPSARSGCTMALWQAKSMGVLFGGVTDTEADEESMESTFHKDLFGYQLPGTGRWISLNLKRPKKMGGGNRRKKQKQQQEQRQRQAEEEARRRQQEEEDEDDEDQGSDDEDRGEDECAKSDGDDDNERGGESARTKGSNGVKTENAATETGQPAAATPAPEPAPEEEDDDDDDPDDPEKTRPMERYNTMLAVQRNVLYLYGGIFEQANREFTLDDFYTLDLAKLEKFNCLKECPIDNLEWNESEDEDDSDDEDDDDDDESDSGSSSGEEGDEIPEGYEYGDYDEEDEEAKRAKMSQAEKDELRAKAKLFMGVAQDSHRSEVEQLSTPMPGEKLRAFYERTKAHWANVAFTESEGKLRGKETRKAGFALAEQKYSEYKPILEEIERIQAEAGLDEAEKSVNKSGGIGAGAVGVDSRNRR
ncbi:uncharacterized protein PFL1_05881 [Pseudozyma flocculosa PF-1]|uniref:DUF4110 domain-containing protein n=2 Tax=Pseudozyma flocculosa TaxID=84751 RepID=A0A5C3F2W5_9BASI|nr:uncharacterized protein PFL1_05881 [Pseudozyma flocculosa PF-1]EPQ26559.1 hypothetical protein PFL1_05881 [Pseudozyma flocculosa PF-1]SPO38450.1 uncharacterized protein PSFLO_03928 [Pseudozyma flocculosa]